MRPLQRARLVDYKAYNLERAAFYGREMIVAMRMGLMDHSYDMALLAFRFAVAGGYYRETE